MFTDADRSMLITAYHLLQEQQLRNAPVVAAAVAGIPAATAKAVVAALPVTPGGSVDVAAIAKAVNDDAAKRLLS
jgi:glycine cleavage system protein P-like pyridoxal-binding family